MDALLGHEVVHDLGHVVAGDNIGDGLHREALVDASSSGRSNELAVPVLALTRQLVRIELPGEHGEELRIGESVAGGENTVGHAGHDALVSHSGDGLLSPVVGGNVLEAQVNGKCRSRDHGDGQDHADGPSSDSAQFHNIKSFLSNSQEIYFLGTSLIYTSYTHERTRRLRDCKAVSACPPRNPR